MRVGAFLITEEISSPGVKADLTRQGADSLQKIAKLRASSRVDRHLFISIQKIGK